MRETAHGLAIGPDEWTWDLLLLAKEGFGVSAETFLYRAEELGMVSRAKARELRTGLAAHYEERRAAGAKDIEPHATRRGDGRLDALRMRADKRPQTARKEAMRGASRERSTRRRSVPAGSGGRSR